jgi:dimethylargininase
MRIAITRPVSPAIQQCELTHLARQPIDLERARAQHGQYEQALRSLGIKVLSLPAERDLPDSVFVEDTAIVLDELAVITIPGVPLRRNETASVAAVLKDYRELAAIQPPATLDGGDVLRIGRVLYVGLTGRSNLEGIEQMRSLLYRYGYTVVGVPVSGCLHLKSAVTLVAPDTLLFNPHWVDVQHLGAMQAIEIDAAEPAAANALMVEERVIYPRAYPRTAERLAKAGVKLLQVDADELAKAEGAVTCCSLIFEE